MKEIPTRIETILTALFAGEATVSETETLRQWLDESADNREALDEYRDLHYVLAACRSRDRYDADKAWKQYFAFLKPTGGVRRLYALCRYAAIIILAFGSGILAMRQPAGETATEAMQEENRETPTSEFVVPYGSKSMVTLSDNSQIWLNAGSKLRYSQTFNHDSREVYIEGEAYFNVARNESKPFMVKTSTVTLKVLGTSFNVKAYPEENNIETTVESGSVQVLRDVQENAAGKVVLTAGQKMTIVKSPLDSLKASPPLSSPLAAAKPAKAAGKEVVDRNVVTKLYTSWKDSCWLIEKETLASLSVKLERRYNVHIALADEKLKAISFSGTLKDESIEQVLEAIKLSAPVSYVIRRNNVRIFINKQAKGREI